MGSEDPLGFTSAGSDILRIWMRTGKGKGEGRGEGRVKGRGEGRVKGREGKGRETVDRKGTHLVI